MKKSFTLILIVVIALTSASSTLTVSAESLSEINKDIEEIEKEKEALEQEKKQIEEEKSDIETSKEDTNQKIKENQSKQKTVKEEINDIDQQLTSTKNDISTKESEIEETNQEIEDLENQIEELKKEIKELEEKIEKRDALLKDRLRSIQQNGGDMKYMEVIFGAQSFGDFISRTISVTTIMGQDQDIMAQQAEDKKVLEANKAEVETKKVAVVDKKEALESQKQELVALKEQLDEQIAERETLMAQLQEEEEQLEEIVLSYEEEQQILSAEASAKQKALALAESKKGDLEQLAKEEKEKQEKEQQQAANNSSQSSSNKTNSSASTQKSTGNSNGIFTLPANGRISSHYGMRYHPIHHVNRLHAGTDFAVGTGTTLVAPADGVVFKAGWGGGFGNVIMISHNINGQTFTTVSAHLSQVNVSVGDVVSEGQAIGATGNTGDSTGPHLHFEVHLGGYGNPVNALPYLK